MTPEAAIVICSTLESRRLPKKAIRKIAGVPVIEHILKRVCPLGLPVILALPEGASGAYRAIINASPALRDTRNIAYYEGDSKSPLHRTASALKSLFGNDLPRYVVRVTHDDILIDAETVRGLLENCLRYGAGYGITPKIVDGAGVEVIDTRNLMWAANQYDQPIEHISYFVRGDVCPNPATYQGEARAAICRDYRLTLDYPEDLVVLEAVLTATSPDAGLERVCEYLDHNPHVLNYNRLPRVSLYTCIRNNHKYLAETVNSIFNNSFCDYEYIIVNDCSENDTLAEVLRCVASHKDKIKVITNETNKGLASSSNIALETARGEYVMRIDADDKIFPYTLERMISRIQQDKAAVVYANYNEIGADGGTIEQNVGGHVNHHAGCALMSRRAINEIKFKDGLRHWDSLELYTRIKDKLRVSYVHEPLWLYRVHGESMSRNNLEERAKIKDTL